MAGLGRCERTLGDLKRFVGGDVGGLIKQQNTADFALYDVTNCKQPVLKAA